MHFRRRFIGVVGVAVFSVMCVAAFAASSLDGTKWRVEITPEGATIPHHIDQVRFEGGKFISVIFERKGFSSAPVTMNEKPGGPIVVEVKQTSEASGDLMWQAEVQGEALKGTLTWKQPDGKVVTHALVGSPAVEEAPASETAPAPAKKSKGLFGCSFIQ